MLLLFWTHNADSLLFQYAAKDSMLWSNASFMCSGGCCCFSDSKASL